MKTSPVRLLVLLLMLVVVSSAHAQLRLPGLFSSHMVIQQQTAQPIWGWADPTLKVTVKVSWDTTTQTVISSNTSLWKTSIKTPTAGGPHTITITAGKDVIKLDDVMSGEVWLCSGQSNMEWSLGRAGDGKDIVSQVNDPGIRLFHVPKAEANTPQVKGEGTWTTCDAKTAGAFSAIGYFFGKKLNSELKIPIGLINASWGGTPAEVWVPREEIEKNQDLVKSAEKQVDDKPWCPSRPGVVYNAMIHPIIQYQIAGALWYQGEGNTAAPSTYKTLMETLILDWRKEFGKELPFYFVQIAPYSGYGDVEKGTLVREQQVKLLEVPKTGMVVISDHVDNVKDIHPQFKKPVGERLANMALADVYGKTGIAYQSPTYKSMKVEKSKVRVSLNHVESGLMSKGGAPTEFQIAGEDQKFYPASAKIDGSTVVVSAKEVKKPASVRFGWPNGSIPNLFSKDGLPVSCFRTDDWAIEVK